MLVPKERSILRSGAWPQRPTSSCALLGTILKVGRHVIARSAAPNPSICIIPRRFALLTTASPLSLSACCYFSMKNHSLRSLLLAAGLAVLGTITAHAQTVTKQSVSLELAKKIAAKAEAEAVKNKWTMVI